MATEIIELNISKATKLEQAPASSAEPSRWTPRSRKSIRHEQALQKEVERFSALKHRTERTLAELEEKKKHAMALVHAGEVWADSLLGDTLTQIERENRKLAAFTDEVTKAQSFLNAFRTQMAEFAPERARIQDMLAELAALRLMADYEIAQRVASLKEILDCRKEIVSSMKAKAQYVDLDYNFDAGISASLYDALSLEIVASSEEWNAIFTGDSEKLRPYVVIVDEFQPEETLARKGIYRFGEIVHLSEAEARPLLSLIRPDPADGRGWGCLPPTLMTVEEFEAEKTQAARMPIRIHLQKKHEDRERLRFEAYREKFRGSKIPEAFMSGR